MATNDRRDVIGVLTSGGSRILPQPSSIGGQSSQETGGGALVTPSNTRVSSTVRTGTSSTRVRVQSSQIINDRGQAIGSAEPTKVSTTSVPQGTVSRAEPRSTRDIIRSTARGETTIGSATRGIFTNLRSPFTRTREKQIQRERESLRQGRFRRETTTPTEVRGGTAQGRFEEIPTSEIERIPSEAATRELVSRRQREIEVQATQIFINEANVQRRVFEDRLRTRRDQLQDQVNQGKITVTEANKKLDSETKNLQKEFERTVKKNTDPRIKAIIKSEEKDLKSQLTRQQARKVALSIPVIATTSFGTGVALGASPRIIQTGVGGFLGFSAASQTAKQVEGFRTGDVSAGELGLFGVQAAATAVPFGAGARIGNRFISRGQVSAAIQRSEVVASTREIRTTGELKRLRLSENEIADIQTLKQQGYTLRFVETRLRPTIKSDVGKIPDVRGQFVEVVDQSGNIIKRYNRGTVIAKQSGKVYSQEVLSEGIGTIEGQTARIEDLTIVKAKKGSKLVPVEAYKTLEQSTSQKPIVRGNKQIEFSDSLISQVGERRKTPKPSDLTDVALFEPSTSKVTPLYRSRAFTIFETRGKAGQAVGGKKTTAGFDIFGIEIRGETGRGASIIEQLPRPEKPIVNRRKPKVQRRGLIEASEGAIDLFGRLDRASKTPRISTGDRVSSLVEAQTKAKATNARTSVTSSRGSLQSEITKSISEDIGLRTKGRTRLRQTTGSRTIQRLGYGLKEDYRLAGRQLGSQKDLLGTNQVVGAATSQIPRQNLRQRQLTASTLRSSTNTLGTGVFSPTPVNPSPLIFNTPRVKFGYARDRRKGKRKSKKIDPLFQASFGSVALNQKPINITKSQYKKLSGRTFTGAEFRPQVNIKL